MFSYCLNNPTNLVDYTGQKPGDLFLTEAEAVRNAAIYIGSLSFINGWEYSTTIYTVTKTYTVEETIVQHVRLDGRRPVRIVETRQVTFTITRYTYLYYHTDKDPYSVQIHQAPEGGTRVSIVHTHPMGSNRGITQFSNIDRKNALYEYNCPIYVYGPNGILLKFDPFSYTTTTVFEDLPISVKQPWKNKPSWLTW